MVIGTWRRAACVAAFGIGLSGAMAQQAEWPAKPVKIFTDAAAGNANDVTIRMLGEQLTQAWKQQVVVLNHPGAGGGIAARAAGQLEPDGYNFYVPGASSFLALKGAPGVSPNLPVVIPRDYKPIAMLTLQPMFIGVSHKLGVSSVKELIDLAKQKPGEISFAANGRGRITHLTMELLQERAGIKLTFVPYAGGPPAAMNDVVSGRIGIVLEGYSGMGGAIEGNTIKGIAVGTLQRLKEFPDMPTVAETLPGFFAGGWTVMLAPNGTPDAIIARMASDVRKAQSNPEFVQKLAKLGAYLVDYTPDEVLKFVNREQETWRPILEKLAQSENK